MIRDAVIYYAHPASVIFAAISYDHGRAGEQPGAHAYQRADQSTEIP